MEDQRSGSGIDSKTVPHHSTFVVLVPDQQGELSRIQNKKTDVAWNFGFGVELIKHIQVSASYGIGMTKAFESVGLTNGAQNIDAKIVTGL